MAEKIETEKVTGEIEELVARTITLTHSTKATYGSTKQLSQQAKAEIAEMRRRHYDEDAEIAGNIYRLRVLSKAEGAISFLSICGKLDRPRNECTRLADNHGRFIALPPVYQQALREARKKASEKIIAKIAAIESKAASEGTEPDLDYVSRELKAMCGRAGKQNNSALNSALKPFLKAVDAQEKFMERRKLVLNAMECLASKVGLYCEFGDDGVVLIRPTGTVPVPVAEVLQVSQCTAEAA